METPPQTIDRIIKELRALRTQIISFKQCSNPDCLKPWKEIDQFYEVEKAADGRSSWCKDCQRRSASRSWAKRKGKKYFFKEEIKMEQPFCEASRDMNCLQISEKITRKNVFSISFGETGQITRNEIMAKLNKEYPINDSKYLWIFTLEKEKT